MLRSGTCAGVTEIATFTQLIPPLFIHILCPFGDSLALRGLAQFALFAPAGHVAMALMWAKFDRHDAKLQHSTANQSRREKLCDSQILANSHIFSAHVSRVDYHVWCRGQVAHSVKGGTGGLHAQMQKLHCTKTHMHAHRKYTRTHTTNRAEP